MTLRFRWLVIIAMLSSFVLALPAIAQEDLTNTYTTDDGTLSINYPSDWVIQEGASIPTITNHPDVTTSTSPLLNEPGYVIVQFLQPSLIARIGFDTETPQTAVESFSDFAEVTPDEQGEYISGDLVGFYATYPNAGANLEYPLKVVAFSVDEQMVIFAFGGDFVGFENTLDAMLQTVRYIPFEDTSTLPNIYNAPTIGLSIRYPDGWTPRINAGTIEVTTDPNITDGTDTLLQQPGQAIIGIQGIEGLAAFNISPDATPEEAAFVMSQLLPVEVEIAPYEGLNTPAVTFTVPGADMGLVADVHFVFLRTAGQIVMVGFIGDYETLRDDFVEVLKSIGPLRELPEEVVDDDNPLRGRFRLGNFSVRYPEGWVIVDNDGESFRLGSSRELTGAENDPLLAQDGNVMLFFQPANTLINIGLPENAPPPVVFNRLKEQFGVDIAPIPYRPLTGMEAYSGVVPKEQLGATTNAIIIVFSDGVNTTSVIVLGDFTTQQETIAAILNSVRYTN